MIDFMDIGEEKTLMVLVEDHDDIFNEVKMTKDQFDIICDVLNRVTIGFSLPISGMKFKVELIDDEEEI